MQMRRMRPVAALTLALLATPFLAATAIAAQAEAAPTTPATATAPAVAWPSVTKTSVRKAVAVARKAAETVARPTATPPPAAVRATPATPAPPPPPSVDDPATWLYPANGPITSPFGRRWGRMHEGVDIDAGYGTAVVAAHRGTVTAAGWGQSGYGLVVHIAHGNGLVTTYNHLSEVSVGVGQVVERGARVGAVGATGSVTAAHLHYEIRKDGGALNPMPWLTGAHSNAGNPG